MCNIYFIIILHNINGGISLLLYMYITYIYYKFKYIIGASTKFNPDLNTFLRSFGGKYS